MKRNGEVRFNNDLDRIFALMGSSMYSVYSVREEWVGVDMECNWRLQRDRPRKAEWRRAIVARTSYSGQEVVSRPRKVVMLGRGGEEGEERTQERGGSDLGHRARRSYFFICASF